MPECSVSPLSSPPAHRRAWKVPATRCLRAAASLVAALVVPTALSAQEPAPDALAGRCATPDTIAVRGISRVTDAEVRAEGALRPGERINFQSVQRAIKAIFALGQFHDVQVVCDLESVPGRTVVAYVVEERALLGDVDVKGVEKLSARSAREKVTLLLGRPVDPADIASTRARIDSMYRGAGYYLASIRVDSTPLPDGRLGITFVVDEGRRLAISGLEFVGTEVVKPSTVASAMQTKPEGFFFWRKGEFNDDKFAGDLGERIPQLYARLGHIDARVLEDTLIVDPERGKGKLRVTIDEGPQYRIGTFGVTGNRVVPGEVLDRMFASTSRNPSLRERLFGLVKREARAEEGVFDAARWEKATQDVGNLYRDRGYIYAEVYPVVERTVTADSQPAVNLRWEIDEKQPAIVNRIEIVGNDYTSEDCIRRAIVLVPGGVFNQSALINSYQQIQNLGFFESPMPFPVPKQVNEAGDVDLIFTVKEKRTGSLNFGASMGQGGVGFGGFIGVEQPNLFGQCKRGTLNWQYGRFFNDFTLTYTDPALRRTRTSGTVSAFRTQSRFIVGNLGQNIRTGAQFRLGFPVPWSYTSALSVTYGAETATFTQGTLGNTCLRNCFRSSIGLDYTSDTRLGMPFPFAGALRTITADFSGGPLGGEVNFQRYTGEYRSYTELASFGGALGGQPKSLVLGLTVRSGALFGNSGPFFFQQQFAVGGVMFGQSLRGYPEFSITPNGFDPSTNQFQSSGPQSFGKAFMVTTGELGFRFNSMLYVNAFFDAGNNWASAQQFNPTRMFRSSGVGVSTVTPLGPLGLDFAYGFDRLAVDPDTRRVRPDPRWQFHFRLGQLF
ncbi:MAG: outer membrane protein assembly factor BamA [Gemmatimonadaceae bacterium]|nr:outer membrane protein assembly factor BamA [Gemmatimonadaceae bacterium]